MPKFKVIVMREICWWDKACIEVEAADRAAAEATARARVETEAETIDWSFKDTNSLKVDAEPILQ